jgi:hypothetical protein
VKAGSAGTGSPTYPESINEVEALEKRRKADHANGM